MLREVLRDHLDHLLLLVEKIHRAFELIDSQMVEYEDLDEIRRLVHTLKGSLQSIGLHDDAEHAIALEESIFSIMQRNETNVYIGKEHIHEWSKQLNAIEFSLKSYLF